MEAVCRCCHRVEKWSSGERVVKIPGGSRVSEQPEWQAMDTLVASVMGELGPVVGACPACGQPMVASEEGVRVRWSVPTARGELACDERGVFHADGRALTLEEAQAWLEKVSPRPVNPDKRPMTWFEAALVLSMMTPVVLWVCTAVFVAVFLWRFELPVVP